MDYDNEYVERLEKIIDKQDALLTQLDAKFKQQDSLNNTLTKQNEILREDIKKHKDLLRDMNKTVNQHKNVVNKLKKELEDQLKIQQDLHKDYGEVIKELTDELEQAQSNENTTINNQIESNSSDSDKIELPPKDFEKDYVSSATNMFKDIKDKSSDAVNDLSSKSQPAEMEPPKEEAPVKCPSCGAEVKKGFIFCDSCGTKLN